MAELRLLLEDGVAKFAEFLRQAPLNPELPPPAEILNDPRYTALVGKGVEIEPRAFGSKLEFSRYIHSKLNGRVKNELLHFSKPLWGWLTLYYFDQLCPPTSSRRRVLKSIEKYYGIGTGMRHHLDKHLLYLPWKLYAIHGEGAAWLLADGELGTDSKALRELANSYRRNVNPAFLSLAKALYFNPATGGVRKGATTDPKKDRGGQWRELDRVIGRLDLTYDVFGAMPEELKQLLPARRFRKWTEEQVPRRQRSPAQARG